MTTKTRLTELQAQIVKTGNRLAAKTAPMLPVEYRVTIGNGSTYGMQKKENNLHGRNDLYFSFLDETKWVNLEHSAQVDLLRDLLQNWPELREAIQTEIRRREDIELATLNEFAKLCPHCGETIDIA